MLDIKHAVEVPDFYCMLAKSMDYDELEAYRQHLMAGGKKAKFKWHSIDHAGTIPFDWKSFAEGANASKALAMMIARLATTPKVPGAAPMKLTSGNHQTVERIAKGQGREVAYICPDGITRNSKRQEITRTNDHIPYSFRVEEEFRQWLHAPSTQPQ
jgi:hypothetical protein